MDTHGTNRTPLVRRTLQTMLSEVGRWYLYGIGVFIAGLCATLAAVWLPISDSATDTVFAVVGAANAAVLGLWGVRWALRWRRTRTDFAASMKIGPTAQWFLRGCLMVMYGLMMTTAALVNVITDVARPVRLIGYSLFLAAGIGALSVVWFESIVTSRKMRPTMTG